MAELPNPHLTESSSIGSSSASSRRPSTARTSPSTSMSDLTQFMNHSTLTCRRTSFDSSRRACYSSHPRDQSSRRHRPHPSLRRPSSSSSSSSNSRSGLNLSRIDSLINDTLVDSDSETSGVCRGRNSFSRSNCTSAAASPSPSMSPAPYEYTAPSNSYFALRHNRNQGMMPIPDTEDMTTRHQYQQPPDEAPDCGNNEHGAARRPQRVMKAIKMRRRKREKHKETEA